MKVLFVNDSTSNPNWGDRAAAIALRTMIGGVGGEITYRLTENAIAQSQLDDGIPALAPVSVPIRRLHNSVRKLTPPALVGLGRRVQSRKPLIPDTWEQFPAFGDAVLGERTPWPAFVAALQQTDAVVIHGDGAVTGNGVAGRTMFFIAFLAKRAFGKPVVMVNHTADLNHPDLREIAHHVYPLLDDVRLRDPISAQRLSSICSATYAADAAFLFEPLAREHWNALAARPTYFEVWPDHATFDPRSPYLCLGGSSILAHAQDVPAMLTGYRELIEQLRQVYDGTIVLTVSDLIDQPYFRHLGHDLGLPVIGLRTPVQQAVDVIGNADVYVGGRWHPSIFALRGGTPIVPLSAKTAKMEGLASMIGLQPPLPNANNLRSAVGTVIRGVHEALAGGPELRLRLQSWAGTQAQDAWNNVAALRSL